MTNWETHKTGVYCFIVVDDILNIERAKRHVEEPYRLIHKNNNQRSVNYVKYVKIGS